MKVFLEFVLEASLDEVLSVVFEGGGMISCSMCNLRQETVLECCFGRMCGVGFTIEDSVPNIVQYSMRKGGVGGGEYGYSRWCYSLECNVYSTCS